MRRCLRLWLVLASLSGLPCVALPSPAQADDAAIRARLEALETPAEAEVDLAQSAERALERAASDRAAGRTVAADRAERIADAAVTLIETRRRRAEAELALARARTRRAEIAARSAAAEQTRASDERELQRLAPPESPAP